MAITDAYATIDEYKAHIRTGSQDDDDTALTDDLTSISRALESRLDTFFTKDASAVARVYQIGEYNKPQIGGRKVLTLDAPLVSVSSIKIDEDDDGSFADETALASTDYELIPRNAPLGPQAEPYNAIRLTEYGDWVTWPEGLRVEVNGVWGWPAVPEAIKRATIELTALLRLETPRARNTIVNGLEEFEAMNPDARAIVWQLLKAYKRRGYA